MHILKIEDIYVPTERRKELDPTKVDQVAEEIISEAEERPISVRKGKERYVLLRGIHRLEAHKALGETTIKGYIMNALQR
ncbi:ParB N-terminal domain-containing protein [Kiloniella antarctica]|uniref:ParB N-terminal domain-containing protein n=1 Tax=Kiloniella antarctica TaxID=1550907 RepID=A0ABW5BFH4_9PROT